MSKQLKINIIDEMMNGLSQPEINPGAHQYAKMVIEREYRERMAVVENLRNHINELAAQVTTTGSKQAVRAEWQALIDLANERYIEAETAFHNIS